MDQLQFVMEQVHHQVMLQQPMVQDCDDTNADVWRTGDFYVDADADTYGTGEAVSLCYGAATPAGYAIQAGDCNDSSATVNPGATEICGNGIDDNCNGSIDEGCVVLFSSSSFTMWYYFSCVKYINLC